MKDLTCFDELLVTNLNIGNDRVTVDYVLKIDEATEAKYRLIHKYEENIITDKTKYFASLMAVAPAINYGLFSRKIIFDVPLTEADRKFIIDMMDATARDIFVNRIVNKTGFIKEEYIPDPTEVGPEDAKPKAELSFTKMVDDPEPIADIDYGKCSVMSSGGKESLLSYGLLKEIGCDVYPAFFNESGHHWFTALTAYKYFKEHEPNTLRVWSNVDRLYNFIGRHMKILKENTYKKKKIEIYPIRLFFFEHYVFSFLPILYKRKVGNIILGNEYDDPTISYCFNGNGIRHYNAVIDQTQEFDKYMRSWFRERGFYFDQWSPVRPLTGLVVQRILAYRYPDLFKLQRSCHLVHKEGDLIVPCGTCSKCNRIILFLLANDVDPSIIGYKRHHIDTVLDRIHMGKISLSKDELEHSLYLLSRRMGKPIEGAAKHDHVEMIQFDDMNSHFDNIPLRFREKIYKIYEQYTKGYTYYTGKQWIPLNKQLIDRDNIYIN